MKKYDVCGRRSDGTEETETISASDEACALGLFLDEREGETFAQVRVERKAPRARAPRAANRRRTALPADVLPMPRAILRAYQEGLA